MPQRSLFLHRKVAMQSSRSYLVQTLMTEWQINTREDSLTLLEALSLRVPAAPRAFLRQACKKKRVLLNGATAEAQQKVYTGDTLTVKTSARFTECLTLSKIPPEQILYEDRECIVLDKPAGLAIHYAQGHDDNLQVRLERFLKLRGETFQAPPIHRLDIGTSGAVLFGKGRKMASLLGRAIESGQFVKRYQALVSGRITSAGTLVSAVPAKGKVKEARTRYRPIAFNNDYSLLELELQTGRQHQIRRQLSDSGWPIIGDQRYRGVMINGLSRPFLHCHQLSFPHPQTEEMVSINCPPAEDLQQVLITLKLEKATPKKTE